MVQILAAIIAILEAIPILDKYFQQLLLLYTKQKVEKNDEAFLKAIDAAKVAGSTKDLQVLLGSKLDD